MRNLFLTSSGLNEKTAALFWKCIGKEPANAKAILVPSAAVENDGAREGIIVCIERLTNMGIPLRNILLYDLAYLLSDEINRTGFAKPLKQAVENGLVYLGISAGSMVAAGNFSDGLGYLANPLIPHAEKESPCGELSKNDLLELADGQMVWIKGERQEII